MSDISTTTLTVVGAAGDTLVPLEPGDTLVPLEQVCRRLAQIREVGELKDIRDRVVAVEQYLRKQKCASEAVLHAAEIKLRIERRIGELLAETVRAGNPQLSHHATIGNGRLPKGVSRDQSSRWQCIAGLPEDTFEAEIAAGRRRGDLSTNALLKVAKREERRRQNEDARRRMADSAPITDLIRVGDFREALADLPDESVDLIYTDPPYTTADLPIYGSLGEFARRVLKPGGSLVCYSPTYNLLAATDQVRQYLNFWTALAVRHAGQASRLNHYRIVTRCKLLLWFVKGRYEGDWLANLIQGEVPDKQAHDWAQGEGEASYCIERMCPPGGFVVDPMCGSGTTVRAAFLSGRRALGCEIDPDIRSKVAAARCDLNGALGDDMRAKARSFNPKGWTPWMRAAWLGLTGADWKPEAYHGISYCAELDMSWTCAWDEIVADLERMFAGSDEPSGGPPLKRLFVKGNKKVGRDALVWNLPVLLTCPGKTPSCEANCYANKGHWRWPDTKQRLARRLQAAEADNFVERAIAELRNRGASKVRIHSSGDFFSPAYVLKWFAIAAALPDVKFWAYTHSWSVEGILPELVRLASLPNVRLWFSCDRDTGLPAAVPNVRACWLQIEDEEPPAPEPGQMALDLVFRTKRKDRKPAKRIGLITLCPTYSGLDTAPDVTCETCHLCFR
jgi:hypothetical protein